jgi:hypothetical protein
MDKAISCKHKEAVGYTTLILKRWVHILLETTVLDSNEKQQKLMIVVQLLIKTLYIEDNTWISPVQDDAWRALVDLIGRGVYPDTKLLNAIADIIETYAKDMERVKKASSIINAAVGHSLSKTTALDEMHSCQRLLLAYIHYVGPMSEGIHAIMQALEYSIDIRSQQKKPQAQVQTDLSALTQISINVAQHGGSHHHQSSFKMPSKCLARLAGLAGVV